MRIGNPVQPERRNRVTSLLAHVCASVVCVYAGDVKNTAPCLCWSLLLDVCVLHVLASLEYRLSLAFVRLRWRSPFSRSRQICLPLTSNRK